MRSIVVVATAAAALMGASPAQSQGSLPYTYEARVEGVVRMQGRVTTRSGLSWSCGGDRCTISGPWPAPGVGACQELARIIGRIALYGRPGALLSAAELVECNAGAPAPLPAGSDSETSSQVLPPASSAARAPTRAERCPIPGWANTEKSNRRSTPLVMVYDRVCINCDQAICNAGDMAIRGDAYCGEFTAMNAFGNRTFGINVPECTRGPEEWREGYGVSCYNLPTPSRATARTVWVTCLEGGR